MPARPDSCGVQNQGAQFILLFWQQIACNYWALLPVSLILSSDHVSLSCLQKALPEAYENQDICHLLFLPVSMVRITSSNDEIPWFDAVCSSESHDFSSQYLWIMAWQIFPVFFRNWNKLSSLMLWRFFKKREKQVLCLPSFLLDTSAFLREP